MGKVSKKRRLGQLFLLSSLSFIACTTTIKHPLPPLPVVYQVAPLQIAWQYSQLLNSSNAGSFIPAIFANALFTADSKGNIVKLDANDGSVISHFYLDQPLCSGVGVSSDLIFVTSCKGYLLAIDKVTGNIKWQAQLPTLTLEAPQNTQDIVVVRTNDGQTLAFNINDGSNLWVYQKPTPPLTLRIVNSFQIIAAEVIAVGLPSGRLALLNIQTGAPIWENQIATSTGATDLDKLTDIGMRPLLDNKTLYVGTYNGNLVSIDLVSSTILWQQPFSTTYGLAIDEQNLYAVSASGIIYAFDKLSGAQIWFNTSLKSRKLSSPALLGNSVLIVDYAGNIHLLNRNDGQYQTRLSTQLHGGVSQPLIYDNGILYQAANGRLALIKKS